MLDALNTQMLTCEACDLCKSRKRIVFGSGNSDKPLIMIVGEAPGEQEDLQGKPFVGKCGEVVTKMLKYAGLERQEAYLTNSVICYPPNNRNPLMKEIEACRKRLLEQIKLIKPKLLVLMGKIATQALLGEVVKGKLSAYFEQRFIDMKIDGDPGKFIVTYHPSYLLRSRKVAYPIMLQHWTDIKDEISRIKNA